MESADILAFDEIMKEEARYRKLTIHAKWFPIFGIQEAISKLSTSTLRKLFESLNGFEGDFTRNFAGEKTLVQPSRWSPVMMQFIDLIELLEQIDANLTPSNSVTTIYERGASNGSELRHKSQIYDAIKESLEKTIELAVKQGCTDPVITDKKNYLSILDTLQQDEKFEDELASECFRLKNRSNLLRRAFGIEVTRDEESTTIPVNAAERAGHIAGMVRYLISTFAKECLTIPKLHTAIIDFVAKQQDEAAIAS